MKLRYVFGIVFYCAWLFWLSSSSNPIHPEMLFRGEDKVIHAVLYGGLAALVSFGIRGSRKPAAPLVQILVPVVFAALYGISDEFHQSFVPHRTADVWDVVADGVGAGIMQVFLCGVVWRLRVRTEP
jgi:VanZ family protein